MDATLEWLMEGDPVIRWQTMRDLLDAPEGEWQAERARAECTGWLAAFLTHRDPDGRWPVGRWTGCPWVLGLIIECGIPARHPCGVRAVTSTLDGWSAGGRSASVDTLLQKMDLCHVGFWLGYGAHFLGPDARLEVLLEAILKVQLPDGGWNCRLRAVKTTQHGSFHTTFNVLDGFRLAARNGVLSDARFREAESRALEFMLQHQMYRSDKTLKVIDERFTHLTFPSYWHYTVLRGLDYMRTCPEIADSRLADPVEMLQSRRKANGRWPVEKRIAGVTLFEMEKLGGDSRWNTLRALRVMRAREGQSKTRTP